MAEAEIVPNPDDRRLTVQHASPPPNQLSRLANAFQAENVSGLLSTVIRTGQVDALQVGTTLANNSLLDEVLSHTAAYKHDAQQRTPASDFNLLSTGSSEEAASALRRLTAGFYEARSTLAVNYDEKDVELCEAFQTVNASYALVISTVHQLFDNDDPGYRERLRPEFLKLLKHDPYLDKLTPAFQDLLGAQSSSATKIALKTFFENFCDNAVEPYIYNEDFSAMVQSILLRELRHVISEEAKLPVEERKLAPYLAGLFEKRMRGELETARSDDGEEQPVLESLRKCPGEAKYLMRSISNFLIESLGEEGEGLTLEHQDVISCEVMLSVGCLLPETELTELLGARLYQVDDLNPSLALVFSSALKFSLYIDPANVDLTRTQINPDSLISLGFKNAPRLSEPEQERLIGEVFAPLTDSFLSVVDNSADEWRSLPAEVRSECVDKVVLQWVKRHDANTASAAPAEQSEQHGQVANLLVDHVSGGAELDALGMRWLVLRGVQGGLEDDQLKKVVEVTLGSGNEAEVLGIEPEAYDQLLAAGGFSTLQILARKPGHEERLSEQLCSHSPASNAESQEMRAAFDKRLVQPLRTALATYADASEARRESEVQEMKAAENLAELARVGVRLRELSEQIPVLKEAMETDADFIKNQIEYREKQDEIQKKEDLLKELSELSTRELVEREMDGVPERLENRTIPKLKKEADEIHSRSFALPDSVFEDLPQYTERSISLKQLNQMEASREECQQKMDGATGASESAVGQIQQSLSEMAEQRSQIRSLFSLVQRAAESVAVKEVDPESLHLTKQDSFDPLGMFCRVSLAVQMTAGRPVEEGQAMRRTLEDDVRSSLEVGFKDPFCKEDSKLVLNEIATLVRRGAPLLMEWNKDEESSLTGYLREKLLGDVRDSAMAWLTHDPGWDESMHAPIIKIFGALAESKIASSGAKGVGLAMCVEGVKHWVDQEKQIRKIEEDNRSAAAGEERDVPERFVTSHDLYVPWAAALKVTAGKSKGHAELVRGITEHLVADALPDVRIADRSEIKATFAPLCRALDRCSRAEGSGLNPLPASSVTFIEAVKERIGQFEQAKQERAGEIHAAAPEAAETEGVSFEAMTGPQQLRLPASPRERGNDIRRIEG